MSKILRQNVGGVDFTMAGCALTGVCPTAAADYVKQITLSDGDVIEDGMMMVVTFANGNSAGNAPNTKTIYSSDQVNYFEDAQLTVPFTLAPAGCYEIEYTGTANAYTYTDYPVFQVGSVSGPVCDYRGHITSGDLWNSDDSVQCMFKEGKFLLLGGSGDAGAGAPVGSYLYLEKKSNPQGYLYCDGSTFDETVYPALYQYLGTNVLPDWREFSAVGAEQNTTNVYDAQTNPNGVIHDHDVFTQGQAKDDQLQNHVHNTNANYDVASGSYFCTALGNTSAQSISSGGVASARVGTVTRGKRKAVFIYIKATSGLTENQQENVLNTINENLSYSTAEHKTGKKWIDGKDIWSATVDCGALPNATSKTVSHGIANIDRITKVECNSSTNAGLVIPISYTPLDILGNGVGLSVDKTSIYIGTGVDRSNFTSTYCTLEYTKTTDN